MGIFKRIRTLEDNFAKALAELGSVKNQLEEINKKLPDYEEAIAKGVDDVWNNAVRSVIDYNPFEKPKEKGERR